MEYVLVYTEVNVLCIILLSLVLVKTRDNFGASSEIAAFKGVAAVSITMLVLDTIWIFCERSGLVYFPPLANGVISALCKSLYGVMGYLVLIFTELRLGRYHKLKLAVKLLALPMIALIALSFASIKTGWIFTIGQDGVYHRGPLYIVQVAVSYFYLFISTVHALGVGVSEKTKAAKRNAYVLASFVIFPAIGGFLEASAYGVPTTMAGATVSVLIIFISFQESQIFMDNLTGLNNRRRADAYLEAQVAGAQRTTRLVFMLADADDFKTINDKFGHAEGDKALATIADAMKLVCNQYNAFLARFGGDEFCFVWESLPGDEPAQFEKDAQNDLGELCRLLKLPYKLTVTIGWAEYEEGDTIQTIIARADKMLRGKKTAKESAL